MFRLENEPPICFAWANLHNALVVGTGDLSELALGWCTYGVGDQMAHYSVNASVPKTLIQHLIRSVISSEQFDRETSAVLQQILATQISPELVPGGGERGSQPVQRTEETIGPFELQDFNHWRAPADVDSDVWVRELRQGVPDV
jgi:NAD+ synthase (glutamine-hydrolysing)